MKLHLCTILATCAFISPAFSQTRPTTTKPAAESTQPYVVFSGAYSVFQRLDEKGEVAKRNDRRFYEATMIATAPDIALANVSTGDLTVESVITDTGQDLIKDFRYTVGKLSKDNHSVQIFISAQKELPPCSGLWITGKLEPWIRRPANAASQRMDLVLELGEEFKVGPVTYKIHSVSGSQKSGINIEFAVKGDTSTLSDIKLYDEGGKQLETAKRVDKNSVLVISKTWAEPLKIQFIFADELKQISIPYHVALPSCQVTVAPAKKDAGDKKPRLAIQFVSVDLSRYPEEAKAFDEVNRTLPARVPNLRFVVDASDEQHIARTMDENFKLESWRDDDKQRDKVPEVAGTPMWFLDSYGDLNMNHPRRDVGIVLKALAVPAADAQHVSLNGSVGLLLGSTKTKSVSAHNVKFETGEKFELDGQKVMIIKAAEARDKTSGEDSTILYFDMPRDLKWRLISAEAKVEDKPVQVDFQPARKFDKEEKREVQLGEEWFDRLNSLGVILHTNQKSGTLTFSAYEKLEEKRLPFDIKVGVGPGPEKKVDPKK